MYRVEIYQDYPSGDFRWLEAYYTFAKDREDAKEIALAYAKEKYKDINVSVINTN